MADRNALLLLGAAFETKLGERPAAILLYQKYLESHDFYGRYLELARGQSELSAINSFEDCLRFNSHLDDLNKVYILYAERTLAVIGNVLLSNTSRIQAALISKGRK